MSFDLEEFFLKVASRRLFFLRERGVCVLLVLLNGR